MGGRFVFVPDGGGAAEQGAPGHVELFADVKDVNSVPEVAQAFGVCPQTIRRLIASGELECIRIGRAVRVTKWVSIPMDTVLEWLDRQAAITRAEFDKPGWEYCETCEEIARLRDENMNLAHDLGECMADRDRYRELCGQMLDAAHEIRRIADANMPEGAAL